MYCSIYIFWLTLALLQQTVQSRSAKFSLIRDLEIDQDSSWLPFLYVRDVSRVLVCANICLTDLRCVAAVYIKSLEQCQLSACSLDLYSTSKRTGLVYMEMGEVHSNGESTTRGTCTCTKQQTYIDCQEAFDSGERCPGVFTLKAPETSATEFEAFCEFDNEHGWTVIQRRLDGSVDFYRDWNDYVNGFGNLSGEYWIGLENIYYLTKTNRQLSVYVEGHDGVTFIANYSTFYIGDSSSKYTITASGYTGTGGDSLPNGFPFTTKDQDNDSHYSNCAVQSEGAWWYSECHTSNLNGVWHPSGHGAGIAKGLVWETWRGYGYSAKADTMMVTR